MPSSSNSHPNAHSRAGSYTNAAEIAAALEGRAALVLPLAVSAVRHYAMLLETQIKANASGRSGPNVITGDYRRSWTHEVYVDGDVVSGIVGTNKPQARRLEYRFVGADSLGRVYDQPLYAHVGPAVQTVGPLFVQALGRVADEGFAKQPCGGPGGMPVWSELGLHRTRSRANRRSSPRAGWRTLRRRAR